MKRHTIRNLFFLHGWATDNTVWERQVNSFSGEYHCHTLSLPGHGTVVPWAEPILAPAVDSLLKTLEEHAPMEGTVAIGWSLGAQVILKTACLKPEYFGGIVLIGATPCFVKRNGFPWGQTGGVVRRMANDLVSDFSSTLNGFYPLNFTERELDTYEAKRFISYYRDRSACFDQHSIISSLHALRRTDLCDEIKTMTIPTLIIHGDEDQVVPAGAGSFMAEYISRARFELFKGVGHAPFLTEADRFNTIVRSFLDNL